MGSSSKKKKEKKKDFQKPKFKVGKARPKPENHTDTSFKSKAIVVNQQSLHTTAPSASSQFTHHLSLLTSRSDSQRKDSLSYLVTAITTRPVDTPLQQPVSIILPKLLPLVLDGSNGVRTQLLRLLRCLPPKEVDGHVEKLLSYIRAGMTHLAADIRSSALDILQWALNVGREQLVTCPGGWVKTIKCMLVMLGWSTILDPKKSSSSGWSNNSRGSFGEAGTQGKMLVKCLATLSSLLEAGLEEGNKDQIPATSPWPFPLTHTSQHMLPRRSNPFGYLNLFGTPRDEESEGYEDREDRQRVFAKRFRYAFQEGLIALKKEAGEVGRAAAGAEKTMMDGMKDFEGLGDE